MGAILFRLSVAMKQLTFGLQPPKTATAAWGARAIYGQNGRTSIELLHDRQSSDGDEAKLEVVFAQVNKFLKEYGEKKGKPLHEFGDPTSAKHTEVDLGEGVTLHACPNSSGGYLYMVAFI